MNRLLTGIVEVAEALGEIAWLATDNGTARWFNRRWYEYTGETPDQSVNDWTIVAHPDDLSRTVTAWSRATGASKVYENEVRLRSAEGRYRWFLMRAHPMGDGEERLWFCVCTDVHERVRNAERDAFRVRLSETLGTLDLHEILDRVTGLLVPELADWALVNLLTDDGSMRVAAAHHWVPHKDRLLRTAVGLTVSSRRSPSMRVAAEKRGVLLERVSPEDLASTVAPEMLSIARTVGINSAVVVPLVHRGRTWGTLDVIANGRHAPYDRDDLAFFRDVARTIAPTIANAESYERERRIAAAFQELALPAIDVRIPNLRFDAYYEAGGDGESIGGDWYDAFRTRDGRVVLSIGDVPGSGLRAAATMAAVRQGMRAVASVAPDPIVILEAVERVLEGGAAHDAPFVTAWVGVFDPLDLSLRYATAGHPSALLRTAAGAVSALPVSADPPLGIGIGARRNATVVELPEGSALLLYTDGLTEVQRDVIEGETRLALALGVVDEANPARAVRDRIVRDLRPQDDIALLFMEARRALGATDGVRSWEFSADDAMRGRSVRHEIAVALRACGYDDSSIFRAELGFGELLGNAVRHARGPVRVLLDPTGPECVLHVLDRGPGFLHNAKLPDDALSENGRGLFLIDAMLDDLTVARRNGGGSHVRAVLPRGAFDAEVSLGLAATR